MTEYLGTMMVIICSAFVATIVIPVITRLILKEVGAWKREETNRVMKAAEKTFDFLGDNMAKYLSEIDKWAKNEKKYSEVMRDVEEDVDDWLKVNHKD